MQKIYTLFKSKSHDEATAYTTSRCYHCSFSLAGCFFPFVSCQIELDRMRLRAHNSATVGLHSNLWPGRPQQQPAGSSSRQQQQQLQQGRLLYLPRLPERSGLCGHCAIYRAMLRTGGEWLRMMMITVVVMMMGMMVMMMMAYWLTPPLQRRTHLAHLAVRG